MSLVTHYLCFNLGFFFWFLFFRRQVPKLQPQFLTRSVVIAEPSSSRCGTQGLL